MTDLPVTFLDADALSHLPLSNAPTCDFGKVFQTE